MSTWQDLKGTTKTLFGIGKNKTVFDSSPATVQRMFTLPDATVDMSAGTVGQVLSKLTATTIGWANAGGGGGGFTEIANAGNISGSYDGNVYGAGTLTVTGNVIVKGSLYVTGKITNLGGYTITVYGDCTFAGEVDFQTNTGVAPGNIDIKGNFFTGESATPFLKDIYLQGADDSGALNPLTALSVVAFASDNFFSVTGDFISSFPNLTTSDHVTCNSGPNAGETRLITGLFFNGTETEITTVSFTLPLDGSETFVLASLEAAEISGDDTFKFVYLGKQKFGAGVNAGQIREFIILPNFTGGFTQMKFSVSLPFVFDGASLITSVDKAFRLNKSPYRFSNSNSKIPVGTEMKFSSTSNNPSASFFSQSVDSSAKTKDVFTAGVYNFTVVGLSVAATNEILTTDKYYHLDDMGMLFTWDTGPAPTINIVGNYYSVGGIKATPRSGNLNGANINIKNDVTAYFTGSSVNANGPQINVNGKGTGNGGNVTIGGKVIGCSISARAEDQTDSNTGNGGNISVGEFLGFVEYNATIDLINPQGVIGSFLDCSAGIVYNPSVSRTLGNAGNLKCNGKFNGASIDAFGGSVYTMINPGAVPSLGGNAGEISILDDCYCYGNLYAFAGAGGTVGLGKSFFVGGQKLVFNVLNLSGGFTGQAFTFDAWSGFNVNYTPTNVPDIIMLCDVIGIDISSQVDLFQTSYATTQSPLDGHGRNITCRKVVNVQSIDTSAIGGLFSAGSINAEEISATDLRALGFSGSSGGAVNIGKGYGGGIFTSADFDGANVGGAGGNVIISQGANATQINSSGGINTIGTGGKGGNVTLTGNFTNMNINANGGAMNGAALTNASGAGGTIIISGNLQGVSDISSVGGNRISTAGAGTAGAGGSITIQGKLFCRNVTISGGANAAASAKGVTGALTIGRGCEINNLIALDGATGTAITTARIIEFNGHCILNSWNIENRTNVRIRCKNVLTTAPNAILFCPTRTGKTVLTKSGGTETASSTSAMFYNGTDWNSITNAVIA